MTIGALTALRSVCAVSAIVVFGLAPAAGLAATVDVTPSSMGSWAFNNRDVNGVVGAEATASGGMVTGPATPPLGTGSANLATGDGTNGGDGTQELRNTDYAGVLLSSITALSYSTYVTQNNGQQFPYFGLMLSTTGGSTVDDILFFEPPYQTPSTGNPLLPNQGDTALNTWQTWDALAGGWWANSGFGGGGGTNSLSLSDYLALYPLATIRNTDGGLGGVRFNVGFASANDLFNGYVDNFTIGISNVDTTYNFDLAAAPVPLPAALPLLASGLVAMGWVGSRRKRKKASALAAV